MKSGTKIQTFLQTEHLQIVSETFSKVQRNCTTLHLGWIEKHLNLFQKKGPKLYNSGPVIFLRKSLYYSSSDWPVTPATAAVATPAAAIPASLPPLPRLLLLLVEPAFAVFAVITVL